MSLFEAITKEEFESSGIPSPEDAGVGYVTDGLSVDTYPCTFCGHCETPNACAWSRECPTCHAPAGKIGFQTYCKTPTGGLVGLHAERWL